MKLKLIAEGNTRMIYQLIESQADKVALEQSIKNLQISVLTKLRNFLDTIGLSKGKRLHSIIEPIALAVGPYATVKNKIKTEVAKDAQAVLQSGLNTREAQKVGERWGFQFPTGYHDVKTGQTGSQTVDGLFDQTLLALAKKAEALPPDPQARLELLSLVTEF